MLVLLVGIATSAILARYLGPERRGVYAIALLLPSLVVNLVQFGIASATVYHTARETYPLRQVVGGSLLLAGATGLVGLVGGMVVVVFFRGAFFPGVHVRFLALALFFVPLDLVFSYLHAVLLGRQLFLHYSGVQVFRRLVRLLGLAVFLVGFGRGVSFAVISSLIAVFATDVVLLVWIARFTRGIELRGTKPYARDAVAYGAKAYAGNLFSFLHLRVDLLILNGFLAPASVGFYAVAVALVDQLALISRSAATALFPRVAAQATDKERNDLTPLVARSVLLITTLGGGVLCLVAGFVVRSLYTDAYLPVVAPLRILVIGVTALAGARVLGNDIAGRGKPMLNSYTTGVALVANIILNIVLIPRWGISGAAWASGGTYMLLLFLRAAAYVHLSGQRWGTILLPQRGDWALYWRTGVALGQWAKDKFAGIKRRNR